MKFETAGDLRSEGIQLSLLDAANSAVLAEVVPSRRPGDTWRSAYVRAPAVPFVIAASDDSRNAWMAFSPPVEMASGSYYAWQATRHGKLLLYFTGSATILLAGLAWVEARRNVRQRAT